MTARIPESRAGATVDDRRPRRGDWQEYERRKAEWVREHADAIPAEFAAAMQRIAREVGV